MSDDCIVAYFPPRECQGEAHEPCSCENWVKWQQKIADIKPEKCEALCYFYYYFQEVGGKKNIRSFKVDKPFGHLAWVKTGKGKGLTTEICLPDEDSDRKSFHKFDVGGGLLLGCPLL